MSGYRVAAILLATSVLFGCSKTEESVRTAEQNLESAVERALDWEGPEIVNPPSVSSIDGVLTFTLTAEPSKVTVAGKTFVSNVYNGRYTAPVLRVNRSDEVRIIYVNNIDKSDIEIDGPESSNVHYHGMGISPNEPVDNPYISIPSSKDGVAGHNKSFQHAHDPELIKDSPTYEYRWKVPGQHPQGLYWFHPHAHKTTEPQILSGMSSMLVVGGLFEEHYPELAKVETRTLILKDIDLPGVADDIMPFTDPEIVVKFLFHCHISEHNDKGMMANMLVKPGAKK